MRHALDSNTATVAKALVDYTHEWKAQGCPSNLNPRWLIAPTVSDFVTGRVDVHSSQVIYGSPAFSFVPEGDWHGMGDSWFRNVKHAVLDILQVSGGMPFSHHLRSSDNRVDLPSDYAMSVIREVTSGVGSGEVAPRPAHVPSPREMAMADCEMIGSLLGTLRHSVSNVKYQECLSALSRIREALKTAR